MPVLGSPRAQDQNNNRTLTATSTIRQGSGGGELDRFSPSNRRVSLSQLSMTITTSDWACETRSWRKKRAVLLHRDGAEGVHRSPIRSFVRGWQGTPLELRNGRDDRMFAFGSVVDAHIDLGWMPL